jgi:hypothetical protein
MNWSNCRVLVLFLAYILLSGCSLPRIVPIQLSRVSQTEFYKQVFVFDHDAARCEPGNDHPDCTREETNQRIDEVFKKLLGKQNWQSLKDMYGLGSMREELLLQKIYIQGLLHFSVYIDPLEQDAFFVEGFGRYFLIREKTGEILLSGDFYLPLRQHRLAQLDEGLITLDVKLFVTVPGQTTFFHEAPLKYKIFMDTSMKRHRIYAIDYSRKHDVYLGDNEALDDSNKIGIVIIEANREAVKLLDLRRIQLLSDDYGTIRRESKRRLPSE